MPKAGSGTDSGDSGTEEQQCGADGGHCRDREVAAEAYAGDDGAEPAADLLDRDGGVAAALREAAAFE
ncbi:MULTISPECIES: hypothetical protein [unclassified Streptomyces]|uniref:hypothetical protein n=1 Tax=unclassified Streptomyces TaxID=2593676 RepID=UPI002DD9FA2E|nr:hypothetical protein [Streptomyces sp. NBC_01445]WSE02785.1 hypothetical protein OG574_04940 [Streptomyces sp. NBC_01445]